MVYIDKYWDQFEPVAIHWHYMAMVCYGLLCLIGFPANMAVIVYYLKNVKKRKSYNYLIVNLMISDITMLLTTPIVTYNSYYGKWMFDDTVCNAYAVCGSLFGFVSIITMAMISIERFLVIKYPLKVLDNNRKVSICLILITWIYGSIWSIIPLVTPNKYVPEGFLTSCTFDFLDQSRSSFITIMFMNVFGFVIPALITALFYALISVHIKKHYSKLKKNYDIDMSHISRVKTTTKHSSVSTNQDRIDPDENTNSSIATNRKTINSRKREKKRAIKLSAEIRLIRSSCITVMMFCLAWSPYAAMSLIAQYSPNRAKYVTPSTVALPTLFAKCSALTNPIFYAFTNKDFVKSLKKHVACQKR